MTDSKQWALEQMQEANTIFEPKEKTPRSQLENLIIWIIEIAVIAFLAFRFY
jgi:hypothetical protein